MTGIGANQSSGQIGCSPVPKYTSAAVVVPAAITSRSLKDFISGIPRAPIEIRSKRYASEPANLGDQKK
jgi:hypothetical protein